MRPAGRAELDSLYFDYPHFDPPQGDHLSDPVPVAIVGAGPVGMATALSLAQQGIRSVLFDAKSTYNDGSRAISMARSSFNLFQHLGVVAPFVDKALPTPGGRAYFRGQEILHFSMPDTEDEKYRPMYNLQQQYIEAYLHRGIQASPLIEDRWQSQVVGLEDTDTGMRVMVDMPDGHYQMETDWVLACDGARSALRKLRGLRLHGHNFEGRYVIADIQIDVPGPAMRRSLFDPDRRPGSTVLMHKQPDGLWRIDYQLREGESEEHALDEAAIRQGVQNVLDDCGIAAPWALEWWSIYSANTLCLDDYRDGRVFFVGDSAHIVPIFGVRGLNNGLLDAHNIGWKLGYVMQGLADPVLLDSYTSERRAATLDVFEAASKSAQFMTPRSRGYIVMRDAALSLALDHGFAGNFANPRNMIPYSYADSVLTFGDDPRFDAGPHPGATAPNAPVDGGYLLDRCGLGFSVLVFGEMAGIDTACAAVLPDVRILSLDPVGAAARVYGATEGSVYLVRPDLYVAARWHHATPDDVAAALRTVLRGGPCQ